MTNINDLRLQKQILFSLEIILNVCLLSYGTKWKNVSFDGREDL